MNRISGATKRWLMLAVLLIAETEAVLVSHYEVRTAVRALFHLPLYHVMLGFIGYGILIRLLGAKRLPPLPEARMDRRYLAAHLACFLGLLVYLTPLWDATSRLGALPLTGFWAFVIVFYLASWLGALLSPRRWWAELKLQLPWTLAAVVLGFLSVVLSDVGDWFYLPMSSATFWTAQLMLRPWFSDTITNPESLIIGTSRFWVEIEPGCSGYEGIGLITLFTLCFLWMRRHDLKFPQALLLWPMAVTVIWIANSIRIAMLVAIGTCISSHIAIKGFHSQAGWIAFSLIGFGLVLAVEKLRWFRLDPIETGEDGETSVGYPAACFLAPLLMLLFSQMLSQAFSVDFDVFYPIRILLVGGVLIAFRQSYAQLKTRLSLPAVVNGLVVYVLWILLVHPAPGPTVFSALSQPLAAIWLVFRVFGSVIVIPITEELAFRGYLLRRLQNRYIENVPMGAITPFSVISSSLLFGVLHGEQAAGTVAGLAYCLAFARRGQLVDAITAHAVTNLCIAIEVLTFGHWSLW